MPDGSSKVIAARLLAILLISAGCLSATQITFTTSLVTPGAPGTAIWEYDYTLTGFSFVTNEDLQILFDPTLFGTLQNGIAMPAGDWDLQTFQPDPGLPDNGVYDLLALVDHPSFTGPFSIQFTLLGDVPPVSQSWKVVQLDSNFAPGPVLDSGTANSSDLPEPAAAWLGIAGLSVLVARRLKIL